jgi:fimbrial chaperone protein
VILSLLAAPVHAAGAVLVWPVNPVIEPDARAAALWLENRGTQPILLQLRIFSWSQVDGGNIYAAQNEIVGTPPMIEIASGARQLVRLTRTVDVLNGEEYAYRVIVDEIPRSRGADDPAGAGVQFQLRYSIPLFVYGEGIRTPRAAARGRGAPADAPILAWRTVMHDGQPHLEVENRGRIHARLTRAELQEGGVAVNMADGLLGYVLAGAKMRWPLPLGLQTPGAFMAVVNNSVTSELIPLAP